MCGRYSLTSALDELRDYFAAEGQIDFDASYNISPGSSLPIVRLDNDEKHLVKCHWGLKPRWAKADNNFQAINARAETIAEKPSFKDAFKRRRCLIPVNGFFEWKRDGKYKQPYYFNINNNSLFAFAGIWERWEQNTEVLESYAIITTEANAVMQSIHHRMPVILHPEDHTKWLSDGPHDLLIPYQDELSCYPINERVNSPANNDKELLEPVKHQPKGNLRLI